MSRGQRVETLPIQRSASCWRVVASLAPRISTTSEAAEDLPEPSVPKTKMKVEVAKPVDQVRQSSCPVN